MDVWELIAREQIRETLGRYAHCADAGRFADLVALFTEDGELQIDERESIRGREALLSFLSGTRASLATSGTRPLIRHHVSSIQIDVSDRDMAAARSYFLAITERGVDHWGRYRDTLVRSGEVWLFRRRRVGVDGRAAGSWAAERQPR